MGRADTIAALTGPGASTQGARGAAPPPALPPTPCDTCAALFRLLAVDWSARSQKGSSAKPASSVCARPAATSCRAAFQVGRYRLGTRNSCSSKPGIEGPSKPSTAANRETILYARDNNRLHDHSCMGAAPPSLHRVPGRRDRDTNCCKTSASEAAHTAQLQVCARAGEGAAALVQAGHPQIDAAPCARCCRAQKSQPCGWLFESALHWRSSNFLSG